MVAGSTWSRRRFLTTAAAGGLGVLPLPALTAARTQPRARPEGAHSETVQPARFGGFSEPHGTERGFIQSLEAFEANCGRMVDVYRSYRNWRQPLINPPITHLLQRTPPPRLYFSVHPYYDSKGTNVVPWPDITAGLHDDVIDSYASELLTITASTPVYMCFHHEPENEEGAPPEKCGTADDFQAAYWYFRNRIQIVNGVPNLTWVMTYMGSTFRNKHGGPARWWPVSSPYPGLSPDQLMGVDIYNRNTCHYRGWRAFQWLTDPAWVFADSVGRPIFIGECGSVEGDACGGTGQYGVDKAQWFDDALEYMSQTAPTLYDQPLEAFCYSNVKGFNSGQYYIDTSPESLDAFRNLATDPFFQLI